MIQTGRQLLVDPLGQDDDELCPGAAVPFLLVHCYERFMDLDALYLQYASN